jgi:hypothetical protein
MDPVSEYAAPVKTISVKKDIADEPVVAAPAYTLVDLQREFMFCTTGVLYAAVPGLHRDLIKDFLRTVPEVAATSGIGVFTSQGSPFFSGLGKCTLHGQAMDMDRILYAVRKDIWDACRAFIGGAVFVDPVTQATYRIVLYDIPLVDRVALNKPGVITTVPTVPVTVFAVNSSQCFAYLEAEQPLDIPTYKTGPSKTPGDFLAMEQLDAS